MRRSSTPPGGFGWPATAGRSARRIIVATAPRWRRRCAGLPTLKARLEGIKSLAGTRPSASPSSRRWARRHRARTPRRSRRPRNFARPHGAARQRRAAGRQRRARSAARPSLAGDMARAWDASSAAAGALMLGARAQTESRRFCGPRSSGDYPSPDAARARPRSSGLPPGHRRALAGR